MSAMSASSQNIAGVGDRKLLDPSELGTKE